MRHMGKSGKTAIWASLAALALLALTGATLHETVGLWFLAAAAVAYVACVAEVLVRRRYRTLLASGIGSILFIAFGIAFLRQWGLAFNPDPDALSTNVDTEHPDLYFYLAAAAGAATLLLLIAGTVLPGRRAAPGYPSRRPGSAVRVPVSRPASPRPASPPRPAAPRAAAPRPASPRAAVPRTATPAKRPSSAKPAAKASAKPAGKAPGRPAAKPRARR